MKSARLAELLEGSVRVAVAGKLRVCRDPNDDMVIECAVLAGAHAIVTGDKDLLSLGSFKRIQIMTPAEFLGVEGDAD